MLGGWDKGHHWQVVGGGSGEVGSPERGPERPGGGLEGM